MRYAVAVGSVLLGWLARELLTPTVGPTALPFIFLFPAVTLAAFYSGFGPLGEKHVPGLLSRVPPAERVNAPGSIYAYFFFAFPPLRPSLRELV
jgi:hypothetical protein